MDRYTIVLSKVICIHYGNADDCAIFLEGDYRLSVTRNTADKVETQIALATQTTLMIFTSQKPPPTSRNRSSKTTAS